MKGMLNYSQYRSLAGGPIPFPEYLNAVGGSQAGFPQNGLTEGNGGSGLPQLTSPGRMGLMPSQPSGAVIPPAGQSQPGVPPKPGATEESYIENILRMNLGKIATVYMTFENNREWNAKVFKGRVEAAGRDHVILSDPSSGTRFLLPMVNLDYATFDQPLNYSYPYGSRR
jgi:spore germination protein Q